MIIHGLLAGTSRPACAEAGDSSCCSCVWEPLHVFPPFPHSWICKQSVRKDQQGDGECVFNIGHRALYKIAAMFKPLKLNTRDFEHLLRPKTNQGLTLDSLVYFSLWDGPLRSQTPFQLLRQGEDYIIVMSSYHVYCILMFFIFDFASCWAIKIVSLLMQIRLCVKEHQTTSEYGLASQSKSV